MCINCAEKIAVVFDRFTLFIRKNIKLLNDQHKNMISKTLLHNLKQYYTNHILIDKMCQKSKFCECKILLFVRFFLFLNPLMKLHILKPYCLCAGQPHSYSKVNCLLCWQYILTWHPICFVTKRHFYNRNLIAH